MFEFFGNAATAILSGGATGLLGSALSLWGEFQKQKELFRHNEKMAEIQGANMRYEAEMNLKQIQVEGDVKINEAETAAFAASFGADKASYYSGPLGTIGRGMMVLVDFLRGLIRPVLTVYLVVLTTMIYWQVQGVMGEIAMSEQGMESLLNQIVMVILYLTSTVVLWWFGTRQKVVKP